MAEMVLVKDLPDSLTDTVISRLSAFTVAFVDAQVADQGELPRLVGSGVLIAVRGKRAILTAHHVLRALPETGRLCLFLERTPEPHTIDRQGFAPIPIARGVRDSEGPD